jgi:CPA1 family monovalent cation:H+ antiporter
MSLESVADAAIKENLGKFLVVFSVSLSVATVSKIFTWFRQIPYTLLLVIVGLGLAFLDIRLVNLSPGLILEIFLPPLLFEAAWNTRWRELKENWLPVSLFAIVGVLISMIGVGFALDEFTSLSLVTALLVGASLASTDPVAVVALFKELGASNRLLTLMEGESLFNDGVAVVAFILLAEMPVGVRNFTLSESLNRFLTYVGLGVLIGVLIGFGISYLTQRIDVPSVEQSLTLVSAYGTYLVAEELGGSGVISVVVVGIILGNFGSRIGMNPRTRQLVTEFWEFLAFFVNSIVFLLIGDQVSFSSLTDNFKVIGIATLAVVLTRFISIFGLAYFSNSIGKTNIDWREQTVIWWSGLRGSVSVALALSLPIIVPARQEIIETVFGVVLFTLLVQGLSIQWLLNKLNLIGDQPLRLEYSELLAQKVALNRIINYMETLDKSSEFNAQVYQAEQELIEKQLKNVEEKIKDLTTANPQLKFLPVEQLRETLLNMEADTYAEFIRAGRLNQNPKSLLKEMLAKAREVDSKEEAIREVIKLEVIKVETLKEEETTTVMKNELNSLTETTKSPIVNLE